jgi:membrane fusion protein (multidrug efflux system)
MANSLGRRTLVLIGAGIVLALALVFGGQWLMVGRYQVSTDNAYVRADISQLSAKVEGYVQSLPVSDNHSVHAGDILVVIDPTDYQARVAAARAALAQAQGSRASQVAQHAWANAEVSRYRPLANAHLLSPAQMQELEIQARQAGGTLASADAAVEAAQAALTSAQLDLDRTIVRAPIDGVVGDRQVQVGQLVRSGSPLMAVVPLNAVYVVANFKETQIAHFHPGQHATVTPDIAHDVHLRAVLDSIAPASGTQFSMIPTDTATGNFTKIVQRVPVRIRIESSQNGAELLRPGLSVTVMVDTHP